jgi:adenosylcobinamide-GDP ribazoletransferase
MGTLRPLFCTGIWGPGNRGIDRQNNQDMYDQPGPSQATDPSASRPSWHPGQWWREIRLAIGFFTRLPFRSPAGQAAEAARAFPVAGAIIGLIGSLIYGLAMEIGLAGLLAALLAVAATVIVGGALHEDGLADFADMLGVRGDRERKLAVMRDSRIGSYGVLALGFSAAIKVSALVSLGDPWLVAGALIAAHAMGRATLPVIMRSLPLARADGLAVGAGKPSAAATYQGLGVALLISAFACGPGAALVSLVVAIVAAFLVSEVARRQIRGYTGDVLGAAQEVAQLAIFINLVALA